MVVVGFVESDVVFSVNDEVACVNVVSFKNHLEDFRLMHSTFLHEVDNFILDNDGMIYVVIELHLNFVLKLSLLGQEVLLLNRFSEIFVVLSQEVELANVGPRVESITHWILGVESNILATSQQKDFVNFSLEVLPVKNMRQPSKATESVENRCCYLPTP